MFLGRRFEATIEDILDFCDIFDDSLRFMFRFCHRKLTKSNVLWFLKLVSLASEDEIFILEHTFAFLLPNPGLHGR